MSSDINSEDPQTPEEVYDWVKGLVKQQPVEIRYSKKVVVKDPVDSSIASSRPQDPDTSRKVTLRIPKLRKNTP